MNPLLSQFLAEARDLIEETSQGLVALEKAPDSAEVLNAVFRGVHTLKGASGIFAFGPLTAAVHAAEDILVAVRGREAPLTPELIDLLLECADKVSSWLGTIADTEDLPPGAAADSARLAARIRAFLPGAAPDAGARGAAPVGARALGDLPARLQASAASALDAGQPVWSVRYRPSEQCFFTGTDPLQLVRHVPGLLGLVIVPPESGFTPLADADPFQCVAGFELLTTTPPADLDPIFEYVADEIEVHPVGGHGQGAESAGEPVSIDDEARLIFSEILRDQAHLLGLPCEASAFVGRVLGVDSTVTGCLTEMRLDAEIPRWKAAVEAATRDERAEDLVRLLAELIDAPRAAVVPDRAAAPTAAEAPRPREAGSTVKVSLDKIDEVMNLVGELVVAKNAIPYLAKRAEMQYGAADLSRELAERYAVLNRIAEALQNAVMAVRMLPLASVFQRFPRVVRDLSRKLDKDVELVIDGEDTEADKSIIDRIAEPLIHLVRNSIDHGIETPAERAASGKPPRGTVRLQASRDGDTLVIELDDDGHGLDTERLKRKALERGILDEARAVALTEREAMHLVFAAGLSTAAVASDVSGRGVGMDVVRQTVEDLGGSVDIDSARGKGTSVRLSLPLTMAVTRVLMVRVGAEKFGVPMEAVVGVVRRPRDELSQIKRQQVLVWRGKLVPIFQLSKLLDLADEEEREAPDAAILLLRVGGDDVGVVVDAFDADTEVVLKPLEGVLSGCRGYYGTAILGDGYTLLVLNPKELLTCRSESAAIASS